MASNRTRKAITNIGFNFLNQVVTLLLGFISRRVFIYTLGVEYQGINSLFSDVLGLLTAADLGIISAMVYSFYKPLAERDESKLSALVHFYRRIFNLIAIAVALLGVAVVPFLNIIVNLNYEIKDIYSYYLLSLSNVVISYLFVYKASILTADQNNYIVVKWSMVFSIIRTLIQIGVLIYYKNYILYLLIVPVFSFVNNMYISHVASKSYPCIKEKNALSNEDVQQIKKIFGSVIVFKFAGVLLNSTDNIIISIIIGTTTVGLYSNYVLVSNKLTTLFSLLFSSLVASIGNLVVSESRERRYLIFQAEQTISNVICCVIIPCFICLIDDFVVLWLDKSFQLDFLLSIAVSLNMYLACLLQPLWTFREATGLYKKTKWSIMAAAILNIILSIIFGKLIGLPGIIFATALSRLLTYIWYEPKVLFSDYFNASYINYYFSLILNAAVVIVISLFLQFVCSYINIYNWFGFLFKGVICLLLSTFFAFTIYRKSIGMQTVLASLKRFKSQ